MKNEMKDRNCTMLLKLVKFSMVLIQSTDSSKYFNEIFKMFTIFCL